MAAHKYYIKGMVCERCIDAVREIFKDLGIGIAEVGLGEVSLVSSPGISESLIEERLRTLGFSLLKDKKAELLNDVKKLVADVYSGNFDFPYNSRFSTYATEKLNVGYDAISETFSSLEHTTVEKYIIDFRINKVKELLVYSDSTLSEIAFALGFTSVSHLSKQFKSYTGLNPSYFREIKTKKVATSFQSANS